MLQDDLSFHVIRRYVTGIGLKDWYSGGIG